MSSLVDSFLADLDDLDDEPDTPSGGAAAGAKAGGGARGFSDSKGDSDGDEDGDDDDDDDDEDEDMDDAGGLESMLSSLKGGGVRQVTNLRKSRAFEEHMERIEAAMQREAPTEISGPLETNDEYQLIVSCNDMITRIHDEISAVHHFVVDTYSKKFPELEKFVPSAMDYFRVVKALGNTTDMTKVDLVGLLPAAQIMLVTVTGSSVATKPLPEDELQKALDGCDEGLALETARQRNLEFIQSRMNAIAPNVSELLGTKIAAQVMGLAGGLIALSKMPACNVQTLGQKRRDLAGFSSATAMRHTGFIYFCELVQSAPPDLRKRIVRDVAGKVALAARVDSFRQSRDGSVGDKFKKEIQRKTALFQEPAPAKTLKALPIPDEQIKKRRGGKRFRAQKERMAMTDVRRQSMRLGFGQADGEYGDSVMGLTTGMLGMESGSGKLRVNKKEIKQAAKRQKQAGTGGSITGIASSLAFTPVQGLELPAESMLPKASTGAKYFGATAAFRRAKAEHDANKPK